MCFLELTATPEGSPRYRSGGSFRKSGLASNAIWGAVVDGSVAPKATAANHASPMSEYRFKVASFKCLRGYQTRHVWWAGMYDYGLGDSPCAFAALETAASGSWRSPRFVTSPPPWRFYPPAAIRFRLTIC